MSNDFIRPEGSTTRMRLRDPQTAELLCDVCGHTWTRAADELSGAFLECPQCPHIAIPDAGAPPPDESERITSLEAQVGVLNVYVKALVRLCDRQITMFERLAEKR